MRDTERAPIFLSSLKGLRFLLHIFRSVLLKRLILSSPTGQLELVSWRQCVIFPLTLWHLHFLIAVHRQLLIWLLNRPITPYKHAVHTSTLISANQLSHVILGCQWGVTQATGFFVFCLWFLPCNPNFQYAHFPASEEKKTKQNKKPCFKMHFLPESESSLKMQPFSSHILQAFRSQEQN